MLGKVVQDHLESNRERMKQIRKSFIKKALSKTETKAVKKPKRRIAKKEQDMPNLQQIGTATINKGITITHK